MRILSAGILVLLLIARSFAAGTGTVRLTSPQGVAIDEEGNVLVTCRGGRNAVVVLSRDGKLVREFGSGHLVDPGGIVVDGRGRVIVANSGRGEVTVFDADGTRTASIADMGRPEHVAVGPKGRVLVSDAAGARICVVDPDRGTMLFAVDEVRAGPGVDGALKNPAGMAVHGDLLYLCDTGNHRILTMPVPREADVVPQAEVITRPEMVPADVAVAEDGRVYVIDRDRVRGFSCNWEERGTFRAKAVRMWFQPKTLTVDREGGVWCVDGSTRRVLGTNADLFDEEPRLEIARGPGDSSTATMEWSTLSPRPTVVRYGPTEDCGQEYRDERPKAEHRVVLTGLEPLSRYHFHVGFPVEAVPPTAEPRADLALGIQRTSFGLLSAGNLSGEYALATLPRRCMTAWLSAPTVVVVYRHVTFPPGADGKKPADRILADADVALLKSELEKYRVWAWRHSSLKLNFDFTYVVVDEPRPGDSMGSVTPAMLEDIVAGLKAQGRDLHDYWYAIVCGTAGWYAHYLAGTAAGSEYELGSCYTGFGPGTRPGWWWFPTHEHGHLVHSWTMCSGCGFFAFPDAPWTLPGKFGENFSFMAANYRQLPVRDWLILKRGVLGESVDANANGVPDDDPRVPLDEKQFGWTPAMGGDCLERMMAGGRTPGHPRGTDTDFDGEVHDLNPGELYWIDRNIPRRTVELDGELSDGEWREFYSVPNVSTPADQRDLRARLYVAWDDEHYYFAVKSERPVIAGFDLDAANNGWFHGRDNLRFSVRPPTGDHPLEATGSIWDFLNDRINLHDGQHWYREAYAPGDIKAATGKEGGWHVIECAVPTRPEAGIAPGKGSGFGLRAYLWCDTPGETIPQTNFFDGEDFAYDLVCVDGEGEAP